MTYAEIKQELGVKKLEFFNVLNEAGEACGISKEVKAQLSLKSPNTSGAL